MGAATPSPAIASTCGTLRLKRLQGILRGSWQLHPPEVSNAAPITVPFAQCLICIVTQSRSLRATATTEQLCALSYLGMGGGCLGGGTDEAADTRLLQEGKEKKGNCAVQ